MAAKTLSEMLPRTVAVAIVGEHRAQPLMRAGVIGIGSQGRLVMRACLVMPVGAKQEIGEVHMSDRVIGVVEDRFRIDATGGIDRTLACKQRSELVERAEIGRHPAQDIDEGRLGVLAPVQRPEQGRAFDLGCDGLVGAARTHEQIVELTQSCFLGQPGSPVAGFATSKGRGLFHCGHRFLRIRGPRVFDCPLSADSRSARIRKMPAGG